MRIAPNPSPNHGPRRDGLTPTLVVLHYTGMPDTRAAMDRLCDPAAEVSAHYLICRTGRVWSLVPEDLRAWHAGEGEWQGLSDINSRSIGIELDNDGQSPFPDVQMAQLEELLAGILERWGISPSGVIGHSDLAPGRKCDPGPLFDWDRLAASGLATPRVAGQAAPALDTAGFRDVARAAGYTADVDDETLLAAVRLRWRPQGRGPLSPEDIAALPVRRA